jgi:hypothetical protein
VDIGDVVFFILGNDRDIVRVLPSVEKALREAAIHDKKRNPATEP